MVPDHVSSTTTLPPRSPHLPLRRPTRRPQVCVALGVVLALLLAACDEPSRSVAIATATSGPSPTATATATPSPTPTLGPNTGLPPLAAVTIDGSASDLQVEAMFACTIDPHVRDDVVLANPSRSSYGAGDLQAIRAYLDANPSGPVFVDAASATGGVLADTSGAPDCNGSITLTNTGAAKLIFPQLALRLEQPPQVNAYHYVLFNECPLLDPGFQQDCPGGLGGNAGPCAYYSVDFTLTGTGTAGTRIEQPLHPVNNDGSCPAALTINPQATSLVKLSFTSSAAFIYRVQVELERDLGNGQSSIYTLDPVRTALVFAQSDQFSCADISSGTPRLIDGSTRQGTLCI